MSSNKIEVEYQDITNRSAWPLVYQKIGRECQDYPYTCLEAKKPKNKPLNRYRDVNPYDHSRIVLKRSEVDYINANLVKMERANRKYILTQGPLASTVGHFWLMVWEQDSRAILMLNKVLEKSEIKCHWYWPTQTGPQHKLELADVGLVVEQISEEDFSYFSTRKFKLLDTITLKCREVVQFHYTTWPDFGVPSSPVAFLDFLARVRSSGALDACVGPAVVHCSAGIGRSGTFCLVDSCLVVIEMEGQESVDIQQVLLAMRRERMGLIQTPDQLRFSYQAIIEGVKRMDPNYRGEPGAEECVYSRVADEEPPPPPPRAESLARPPARPLPAIPASMSLGNLDMTTRPEASSSDEEPPTPPPRDARASPAFATSPASPTSSADDEDDDPAVPFESSGVVGMRGGVGGDSSEAALRRRRAQALAERVTAIKRRARDAERWHNLKRLKTEENPKIKREHRGH